MYNFSFCFAMLCLQSQYMNYFKDNTNWMKMMQVVNVDELDEGDGIVANVNLIPEDSTNQFSCFMIS